MTRRVWLYWDGFKLTITKTEGEVNAQASVTVRPPDVDQIPWGVWINGQRSPGTWVLVNGAPLAVAHASGVPILCHSIDADAPVWDQHEARGGGQSISSLLQSGSA
jgi:hypothetical protein